MEGCDRVRVKNKTVQADKYLCHLYIHVFFFYSLHNTDIKSVDLKTSTQINPQGQPYFHQKPSWGQICLDFTAHTISYSEVNCLRCSVLTRATVTHATLLCTLMFFMKIIHKELLSNSIVIKQLKDLNKGWGKVYSIEFHIFLFTP